MLSAFVCKQFKVHHQQSTMKVGTDALLLATLGYMPDKAVKVLEIGCGCGIISLVWKQRFEMARVAAIDIHQPSVEEAAFNFKTSPWYADMQAKQMDFTTLAQGTNTIYDVILSNPPFFQHDLKSPDAKRNLARHNDHLSFEDLLNGIRNLLSTDGVAHLILPKTEACILIGLCSKLKLFVNRLVYIYPSENKAYNRVVISLGTSEKLLKPQHFYIRNHKGAYSKDYRALMAPLLIHF